MSTSSDYLRSFFQDNNLFVPEEPTEDLENSEKSKENVSEKKSTDQSEKIVITAPKESKKYANQKEINLRKLFWAIETEEKQFIKEARRERDQAVKTMRLSYSLSTWQQIMRNVFCQWKEQSLPLLEEKIPLPKKRGRPRKQRAVHEPEEVLKKEKLEEEKIFVRVSRGKQEYLPEIQNPFPRKKETAPSSENRILEKENPIDLEKSQSSLQEEEEEEEITNNTLAEKKQEAPSGYRLSRNAKNQYREESIWKYSKQKTPMLETVFSYLDTVANKTQEGIFQEIQKWKTSIDKKSQETVQYFQKTKKYISEKKANIAKAINTTIKVLQEEQKKKRERKEKLRLEYEERKKAEALLQKQKEEQAKKEQEEKLRFEYEERKKVEQLLQSQEEKKQQARDEVNSEKTQKQCIKKEVNTPPSFFSFELPKSIQANPRFQSIKEAIHIGSMVAGVFLVGTVGLALPGWMQQYEHIWNADAFMERQQAIESLVNIQTMQLLPVAGEEDTPSFQESISIAPPDTRIVIPKIAQNIPIVFTGENARQKEDWKLLEKEIQKGLQDGVVHYPGTATPGENGNVFITGHSSYYAWDKGRYKDVFAPLHNLEVGDEYFIYHKGKKHTYKITERKIVPPSDTSVLDQNPHKKESTLMTCTPIGTAKNRLILKSEEISE